MTAAALQTRLDLVAFDRGVARWAQPDLPRFFPLSKLYRPDTGQPDAYPNLQPILTRSVNWALSREQYDEMVKYATALRLGTAETEGILRRFTRNNLQRVVFVFDSRVHALRTRTGA